MNTDLEIFINQPDPVPPAPISSQSAPHKKLLVLIINGWDQEDYCRLAASLALRGPGSIIMGGDNIPLSGLVREISRRTTDLRKVLERLHEGRAFSCAQLSDLLNSWQIDSSPLVVLDFLQPFSDRDMPLAKRLMMLKDCVNILQRLACFRPVAVLLQTKATADCQALLTTLAASMDPVNPACPVPLHEIQPAFLPAGNS